MYIPALCIALLSLLVFLLGFRVTMVRAKSGTFYGGEADPTNVLYKARRAHGNTIEFVPILAITILALGQSTQPTWILVTMVLATAFRYLHSAGILLPATMEKANPMRFFGALGTYACGLLLAGALLLQTAMT